MKISLHQGSVLSPLLFAAVMDVVSSEVRSGLPSELLYADDLVIMAPTMEQLGRRVADWRASLLGKGLIQNPFLTAQSTQIKSVISVPIKDLFITILGHCLTTYPGSVRTFTTYPGRCALLRNTRVGAQFNDIPGSAKD